MDHRKLQLQPRLQMLADLIPIGAKLVDVGTDHGYLPVWLLQERRISHAIASDINPEPLEHARRTAAEYGAADQIDFRLCAGLDHVAPNEVDTIVIAGMGGETIMAILQSAPWTRQNGICLFLQPMTKVENLRIWLADNGFTFTGEHLVYDKNFLYPILCVTGGMPAQLSEADAYGGVALENDPLYGMYLDQQMKKLQRRIAGLNCSESEASRMEAKRLEDLRQALVNRREGLA